MVANAHTDEFKANDVTIALTRGQGLHVAIEARGNNDQHCREVLTQIGVRLVPFKSRLEINDDHHASLELNAGYHVHRGKAVSLNYNGLQAICEALAKSRDPEADKHHHGPYFEQLRQLLDRVGYDLDDDGTPHRRTQQGHIR